MKHASYSLITAGLILGGFILPFTVQAVTADDVVCTRCVGTTDLGDSAVSSVKILNGTILNADINAAAAISPTKISGTAWTATTDGSGSTLDADLLDTLDSSQFLRNDISGVFTGDLTLTGNGYVSGNFGIGTTAPRAALDVSATSGALFTGTYGTGSIPVEGAGTRLMWYPGKAAFRVGYVGDTQWDDVNVGTYSLATGAHTTASGEGATSLGYGSTASGEYATASGFNNNATGNVSVALGNNNVASGNVSVAMGGTSDAIGYIATAIGNNTTASGDYSVAMGNNTTASGASSTALGYDTTASGSRSTAMGYYSIGSGQAATAGGTSTTATGYNSLAFGESTTAQAYDSAVFGRYNDVSGSTTSWVETDPLFVIGNGSNSTSTSNAMTVLKNGNVGIADSAPSEKLDIQGNIVATGTICGSAGCVGGSSTSSQWTTSGSNIYYNTGYIGIGTSSPSYSVDATGYVRGQTGLCIGTDCRTSWPSSSSSTLSGSGTSGYITKWNGTSSLTSSSNMYESSSNIGIGTTSPSGKLGISQTSSNWGLYVTSSTTDDDEGAVYGAATSTGDDNTVGVYGVTASNGNSSGQPIGVRGDATEDSPTDGSFGMLGYNYARNQTSGHAPAGVWGGMVGVPGAESAYSGYGNGVQGETYSNQNLSGGGIFYALSTTGEAEAVAAKTYSSDGDSFAVYASGNTSGSGSKSAIVYTESQGPTALYVEESAQIYFTDYGIGQLVNGQTEVKLDPLFFETVTIDAEHPLMAFIQMNGPAQAYVEPGTDGFTVRQIGGQGSNASFSYRVVAARKYYEDRRLPKVKASVDMFMRPDQDWAGLKSLNDLWDLEYEGSEVHTFPEQVSK